MPNVVFIGYLVSETCLLQKNGSILARNPQRGYFGIREGLFWLLGLYRRGAILDFTKFEKNLLRGYFGMGGGLFWRGQGMFCIF